VRARPGRRLGSSGARRALAGRARATASGAPAAARPGTRWLLQGIPPCGGLCTHAPFAYQARPLEPLHPPTPLCNRDPPRPSRQLVVWDLRMASSSVRNFGAASKAVLHQVDVARRVQHFYESSLAEASPFGPGALAGSSFCGGGLFSSGGGGGLFSSAAALLAQPPLGGGADAAAPGAAAAALGGGGGCFFSQLLPCPADPRLLAFVQTNLQVGFGLEARG
jgi:hypothetical protein